MVHITYNLIMYYACVDHEMHTHFATQVLIYVIVVLYHEHMKKHMSYICIYTRFFTHVDAIINYTCI